MNMLRGLQSTFLITRFRFQIAHFSGLLGAFHLLIDAENFQNFAVLGNLHLLVIKNLLPSPPHNEHSAQLPRVALDVPAYPLPLRFLHHLPRALRDGGPQRSQQRKPREGSA